MPGPRGLLTIADGVRLGALGPGTFVNLLVLETGSRAGDAGRDAGSDAGTVVVDTGLRWQRGRLARLLRGVDVATHVVSHAHADHLGSTAWLCEQTGASLAMGRADAALFERGRIDTVRTRIGRVAMRATDPERRRVDRPLADGDRIGDWEVLETPGHSPGSIALWRAADGVLVHGHGPTNLAGPGRAERPRWLSLPRALNDDAERAALSRRRLVDLEPRLVVSTHGSPGVADDAWRRAMLRA